MTVSVADMEAELAALARRLDEKREVADQLTREVRAAVEKAQAIMPMTSIARGLRIDRSTLYRVYAPVH